MKKIFYIFLLLFLVHCKERYEIPTNSPVTGYLVVEGHINSGGGATSFQLSRTVMLSGNRVPKYELKAKVQVEDQNSTVFPLTEKGGGFYSDTLKLNTAQKYRLRIKTSTGSEYLSDLTDLKTSPPIDSVNWIRATDGVHIYVNTHDNLNSTKYYQWNYVETWEYHSAEQTDLKYSNGQVLIRTPAEQVYQCWTTQPSTNIFIGSTAKLTKDIVYESQLMNIPIGAQRLSYIYSIIVQQYALSSDAYDFLDNMKKNTESLGSIFDPQPSALKGNIHSTSNPDEPVIGFVTAGTVSEKRIFIYRNQLASWPYYFSCVNPDTLVANKPDSIKKYFGSSTYLPVTEVHGQTGLTGWMANETGCVDCRTLGGINVKPSFWP